MLGLQFKRSIVLLAIGLGLATDLQASDKMESLSSMTTNDSSPSYTGAQFSLIGKQTRFLGKTAQLAGGQLGFSFSESFLVGVSGYSLMNKVYYLDNKDRKLDYGIYYFSGFTGWNFFPRKIVNFTLLANLGHGNHSIDHPEDEKLARARSTSIMVLEPQAVVEINLTKNLRAGVGYSYRIVENNEFSELQDSDVNGGSVMASFNILENLPPATRSLAH